MRRARLAALAGFPVVFPLLVLAASPGRLAPWLPRYRYDPLPGDAYGYYSCVREILATARRDAPLVAAAVVVAVAVVAVTRRLTVDDGVRAVAVSWALGIVAAAFAAGVRFTGAPQIGWPLVWSLPMLPLRVVGAVGPDAAFVPALALSLACNAVAVIAAYALARRAGLRDGVAVAGAALVSLWPLLSLLTGPHASWNGAWQEWLGLSLYTEPLSTVTVLVALAILVDPRLGGRGAALAGALLGLATLVRVSNVLVLGVALAVLAWRRQRRAAALLAASAAAWAPAVLWYWPKGYPKLGPPTFPAHPFALSYARAAWSESYLWHPAVLLVLVPLAVVGALAARRSAAVLLWGAVAATAAFYTFYEETPIHPRFLYVILPIVLVYWAAGVDTVLARVVRRWASRSSRARAG